MKKNISIILIGLSTLVLAIIAIVTAIKIYQSGTNPVAPNVPESKPAAQTEEPGSATLNETSRCTLAFNLTLPTATPTPTLPAGITPTATSAPTATPTPLLGCYHACDTVADCESGFECQLVAGSKKCVTPSCPDERDCVCNKACWGLCSHDNECGNGNICHLAEGTNSRCVNPSCETKSDCNCTGITPTPTKTATATPTKTSRLTLSPTPTTVVTPELPEAGSTFPTLAIFAGGLILLLIPLLLMI
jgi:hypothetical protein